MKKLNELIDRLIYPGDKKSLNTYWKGRFFVIAIFLFTVLFTLYVPTYYSNSDGQVPYLEILMYFQIFAHGSILFLYTKYGKRNLWIVVMLLIGPGPGWVATYYGGGGLYSADMAFSTAAISLIFLLSNRVVGIIATLVTIGVYVFYYYTEANGISNFRTDFANITPEYYLESAIFSFVFAAIFILLHEFHKNKYQDEINKSKALIKAKNKEITDSIRYAQRIQNAILPPTRVIKEHLKNSFILYKPKDIVAGDFYWIEPTNNSVLFAAADCTGHGVPGAMVSVICNAALNRSVREYGLEDPAKILDKAKEIIVQEFEKSEEEVMDGMDIALCSIKGNILRYAGANNPCWIVRNGEILETKANRQPIGKYVVNKSFISHTVELQKGDTIYLFSDGYVDQFGDVDNKKFGKKKFKKLLISLQHNTMEEQHKLLEQEFESWKGEQEQVDDLCVIGVKV